MSRSFDLHGFLGDDLAVVARQVRDRYVLHVALFNKTNAAAWALQYSLHANRDSARDAFGAAYYGRVLMLVQTTVLCLERGITPAASVVLRTATETLFTLGALARRPERIERIVSDAEIRKRDMLKSIQRADVSTVSTDTSTPIDSERIEELLATTGSELSAYSLAEDAGLRAWYLTIYARLSWPVHAAANDLETHIVVVDGELQELVNEPMLDGQEYLWMVCTNVCILAMQYVAEIFVSDTVAIESLNREFEDLYESE